MNLHKNFPLTNDQENFEIRPWGRFKVLTKENGVWVKQIEINPSSRLSLQTHEHRSEQWVIAKGRGIATVDNNDTEVAVGDCILIPKGTQHRIANTGSTPLVFIELALGDYLEEDDIIRHDDDYGRSNN